MLDNKEKTQFVNSKEDDSEEPIIDPSGEQLENLIDLKRTDTIVNPKIKNESRQPNQYFSHGQGGEYRMQEGRDYVWNSNPDNFINPSTWNTN